MRPIINSPRYILINIRSIKWERIKKDVESKELKRHKWCRVSCVGSWKPKKVKENHEETEGKRTRDFLCRRYNIGLMLLPFTFTFTSHYNVNPNQNITSKHNTNAPTTHAMLDMTLLCFCFPALPARIFTNYSSFLLQFHVESIIIVNYKGIKSLIFVSLVVKFAGI